MNFPENCTTNMQRYQYTCKAQDELKTLHNVFAKWLNDGISRAEYDAIPISITKDYYYKAKLPKEDWDKFYKEWKNRLNNVLEELCTQRARTEDDYAELSVWTIDIGAISKDARKL